MYGYDKSLKYTTDKITQEEFTKIFKEIDKMPMRREELKWRELDQKYYNITDSDLQIN